MRTRNIHESLLHDFKSLLIQLLILKKPIQVLLPTGLPKTIAWKALERKQKPNHNTMEVA